MVKLPQHIEELRLKYNVKFPKNIDFSGAKKIVFDKRAKPDYAQTTAMTVSPSTKIEVENIQDKDNNTYKSEKCKICSFKNKRNIID